MEDISNVDKLIKKFPHFDFSSFESTDCCTKSTIICKKHGKFLNMYSELIRRKTGCPGCIKDRPQVPKILNKVCSVHGKYSHKRYNSPNCRQCVFDSLTLTHEEFINRLTKNNKYFREKYFKVIGKYIKSPKHIEVETIFGICLVSPNKLLGGRKPTIRSAIDKTKFAINEFIHKHGDIYDYKGFKYISSHQHFNVLCKKHGLFKKTYTGLKLTGCRYCSYDKLDIGFTKEDFIRIAGDRKSTLYLVEIHNKNERFIKIGITCRGLKTRFANLKFKELAKFVHKDAGIIFDKEKYLHTVLEKYSFLPKNKFNGYTECYSIEHLNKIKDEFRRI